jgi:hypothetical protein
LQAWGYLQGERERLFVAAKTLHRAACIEHPPDGTLRDGTRNPVDAC